jgi:hypothetical protein
VLNALDRHALDGSVMKRRSALPATNLTTSSSSSFDSSSAADERSHPSGVRADAVDKTLEAGERADKPLQ